MKQFGRIYLNVPEAIPGPRFREDSGGVFSIIPGDLLRVPLKMSHNIWVNEVVHNPTPQWTTPGLVYFCFTLKFTFDVMALELYMVTGYQQVLVLDAD